MLQWCEMDLVYPQYSRLQAVLKEAVPAGEPLRVG